MFEKYQPIELTRGQNKDSLCSRGPADKRLASQAEVIGVSLGDKTKAYPLSVLAQSGPLKGRTLRWVDSVQCRWFAWSAEYPDTRLHAGADAATRQDDDTAK